MTKKVCYICSSGKYVDAHHYDCQEGRISPETVPLCRRCHRTYHDLGVEWFEDEYLDKAIEIENKRQQLVYDSLKNPVRPLQLLKKEDIARSDYWNKIHGILKRRKGNRKQGNQLTLPLEVGPGNLYPMNTPRLFDPSKLE